MSNVLFIKANDRPADQAISVKLYNTFWRAIKKIPSGGSNYGAGPVRGKSSLLRLHFHDRYVQAC